jgi:hypothetical protein
MRFISPLVVLAALALGPVLACDGDNTPPIDSWVNQDGIRDSAPPDGTPPDSSLPDRSGSDAPPVSFSAQVLPVLTSRCSASTCHGGSSPGGGMRITTGTAYSSLVGKFSTQCTSVLRVKAWDPDNSYLMHKLSGKGGSCFKGDQMPKGAMPLITADVNNIYHWIWQGAANN